ncbi:MAG: hypothetical protein JW704_10340 [Anaerolineaceae bacterium]|nr:hypothetical protein [Anaerolineaceae bacterium]
MLGDVIRQQASESKVSTKLRDQVLCSYKEERKPLTPTLRECADEWQEFWLYASGTKYWCPRECAIRALFPVAESVIDAETLWNFDQGKVYHELFQNKILPSLGGVHVGKWVASDGTTYEAMPTVGDEDEDARKIINGWCPKPDYAKGVLSYVEPKVRMLTPYRVVVKVDSILDWGDDGYEIQEFKTAKLQQKDSLDPMLGGNPVPEHVEQVQIAMWATGIRKARLTYIFKNAPSLRSVTLEHEIPYDVDMVARLKALAVRCTAAVMACDGFDSTPEHAKAWINERFERLPDCTLKSKGRARYCGCRDVCFAK